MIECFPNNFICNLNFKKYFKSNFNSISLGLLNTLLYNGSKSYVNKLGCFELKFK
jgi:hypothetical protein